IQHILGTQYKDTDWRRDSITVKAAVEKLAQVAITRTGLKICIPARQPAPQLVTIEDEVLKLISELKADPSVNFNVEVGRTDDVEMTYITVQQTLAKFM
ncbi:hypothetical protein PAXRUDRAFT_173999, partial [Paxillus rubicundulus Ve08.2h10]